MKGNLYLIPNSLGGEDHGLFIPPKLVPIISGLKYYIVENTRNARRYLKQLNSEININEITFFELNKHTPAEDLSSFLNPLRQGKDTGILSEAGLPGIADPGAGIVKMAHAEQINVVPLTGPSSIFLALMASGLNGQLFCFKGYLPINSKERIKSLQSLEKKINQTGETQIFIETPYRNNSLLKDIINSCGKNLLLSIAANITTEQEFIKTKTIGEWMLGIPDLHKCPAVFLIGKNV